MAGWVQSLSRRSCVRPASDPLLVFIGHSFSPRCGSYLLSQFRETMRSIETELNSEVRGPAVTFVTELTCEPHLVSSSLLELLAKTRFGVLDISDNNPNVLFELGHLRARGVPVQILKSQKSLAAGYEMPIYVRETEVEFYADALEIGPLVMGWLRPQIDGIGSGPAVSRSSRAR